MNKIEKLTPEQESKIPVYRDKWLNKIFKYDLYQSNTEESVQQKRRTYINFVT